MNDHVNVSVPSLTNSKDLFQPQFFVLIGLIRCFANSETFKMAYRVSKTK